MNKLLKMFKVIGTVIMVLIVFIAVVFWSLSKKPAVKENYGSYIKTDGVIEAKYLQKGKHETLYMENTVLHSFKKYEIYYPGDIADIHGKVPAVVFCNGTGVKASKYPALLRHMASWGFIVIATEEEYSWNGFSAEMCVRLLEKLNDNQEVEGYPTNPFYAKIDMENIGLSGHSQGGVGVINAATANEHGNIYKTICSQSPTNITLAEHLEWDYDPSKVTIPIFLISSTGDADENLVISLTGLREIYELVPDSVTKIMARRNDADHGDMLCSADGYITAWFMWQLQCDEEAASAFDGDNAEILGNELYQDQQINIIR